MKRCGPPLEELPSLRKQRCCGYLQPQEADYKLRMLRNWELTPEASRFLSIRGKIDETLADSTSPQLCLVVYSPNVYQRVIDEIAAMAEFRSAGDFGHMDIETVAAIEG